MTALRIVECGDCHEPLSWDDRDSGYVDTDGQTACATTLDLPDGPFGHEPYEHGSDGRHLLFKDGSSEPERAS